jgi:hypothetical protein
LSRWLILGVAASGIVILWLLYFRVYRVVFPEGFENPDEETPEIESWLMRELDSMVLGRDEGGRYWVIACGLVEARRWRKLAADRFGLDVSQIKLRGVW